MVENKYKVYVCCNTYNHAAYITDALNGFVMQETNFPFVVCVIDDASTDGEQDVIRQYVNKNFDTDNPDVAYQRETDYAEITFTQHKTNKNCFLVVHYLKYNHYQHNISMRSYLDEWRNDSEYIALCEGDDYWTDPLKLQKQVDFLENNQEYSLCGHNFVAYNEIESKFETFHTGISGTYQLYDLIRRHVFCSTLSLVYRKSALDYDFFSRCRHQIDIVLAYMLLKNGKGFCLPNEMAVYRIHRGGVWSGSNSDYHITLNFDVRLAIYELEKSQDAARFILTYLKKVGRRWMVENFSMLIKSLQYIKEQFGISYTAKLITNIIFKV